MQLIECDGIITRSGDIPLIIVVVCAPRSMCNKRSIGIADIRMVHYRPEIIAAKITGLYRNLELPDGQRSIVGELIWITG